jgi:hypothetical protein
MRQSRVGGGAADLLVELAKLCSEEPVGRDRLEPRLVPLNAVIALMRGHGGWPTAFAGDDLGVRWLEVPVTTSEGVVTVDVLAYSAKLDLLVPIEVKSGANADEEQARKYASMAAEEVCCAWLRSRGPAPARPRSSPCTR